MERKSLVMCIAVRSTDILRTETGRLMTSVRPSGDKDWDYLRILPQVQEYVWMKPIGSNLFECVALDGLRSKSTINSQDPPDSFHTKDLFTKHPTIPNRWKFASRLDDRLTLVNGEKVLPIPIEGRIRQEQVVKEAVVFGDGKSVPGVIIFRSEQDSDLSEDDFMAKIWPAIEDANSRAESFSRIPRDLVLILPADTSYSKTDKGTFIRAQVYAQFNTEIETMYQIFESSVATGTMVLSIEETEQYLLYQFKACCDITLPSTTTDFFSFGVDSLQCMKMWSNMRKDLDLGENQTNLGQNVLYETGTIAILARHLHALRLGSQEATEDHEAIMNTLIAKYSNVKSYPSPDSLIRSSNGEPRRDVVVSRP